MSLTLAAPMRAGSVGGRARGSVSVALAVVVVLLVIVGGLSFLALVPTPSTPGAASSGALSADVPPFTHGDLNVTAGQVFIIQPIGGSKTYYQGGNITVFSGGTLIVRNVTLSFVQFISDNGTPIQRLSHIYRFQEMAGGDIHFYNATLTTDVQVINAWSKLNFTIEGTTTTWNTSFEFPGWLNVEGTSGSLTLNSSTVTGNPAVPKLLEPSTIQGDSEYAASIAVTNGAVLNVFNSTLNRTYADDTLTHGHPQPLPLGLPLDPLQSIVGVGDNNFTDLPTPTDSANLTQDWLYPNAIFVAGDLVGNWTNTNKTIAAAVNAYVWYDEKQYFVGSMVWKNLSSGGFDMALPANLLANITDDGMLNYLNWTGDFGVTPSRIAIDFEILSGPPVGTSVAAYISILPNVQYNMLVAGPGSTVNSVDSQFGLTWNSLPANATSQLIPYPWNSNKLLLIDHAVGYFANATVQEALPGVFSHSAVLPDATSEAFFYRWAQFNLTGRGGKLAIPNARVSAFYAYSTDQADNQTANALNDLATANPAIWGYVQYWDEVHGAASYGESNVLGHASILLASSNITSGTLPDGYFLGGYHVGVAVSAPGVGSRWFNWSVSPYPEGVAQAPPNVAGPDFAPPQNFPAYFGGVSISSFTVTANGVASTNINLGQTVSVQLTVEDVGTAPIIQLGANLYYEVTVPPGTPLASFTTSSIDLTAPGQTTSVKLNWVATANVTGIQPKFQHNLTVFLSWNHNNATLAGGNLSQNVSVTFLPTTIVVTTSLLANGVPSTTVYLGQVLTVRVVVSDVGNATIAQLGLELNFSPTVVLAQKFASNVDLTTPGQQAVFLLNWTATHNVTLQNDYFVQDLKLSVVWNPDSHWLGNGSMSASVPVTFGPTVVAAGTTLLANGVANATVELGQTLGVSVMLTDVGNGTIGSLNATLLYNTSTTLATYTNTSLHLTPNGATFLFLLSWKSTENVTGLHGWFTHNLTLKLTWNGATGFGWLGTGNSSQNVTVKFAPSEIRFTAFSLPPTTINLNNFYESSGTLEFNGSHQATATLTATPMGGGAPVIIASAFPVAGTFSMPWYDLSQLSPGLTPGTSYTLTATATYNGRTAYDNLTGIYSVPPTPSSSSNFFTQKVLGLPLWAWLAIAAAIVIGIVAFLLVARRQAAGKLVECGECGNLIPEDATVCPKCGAEFETDLLRCSRCASTIPADSKFCPECGAQLLGTPGEEKADPERQAYADFTEKYRAEAKRELGDNYSEGAFWDWWKRQPTYTPFSQWSLQQGQGTPRAGMTAPPAGKETAPSEEDLRKGPPPKGATGTWTESGAPAAAPKPETPATTAAVTPTPATVPPPAPGGAGLKKCPSCGKEIPAEYLVCPFCNAVTQ